MGKKFMGLDGTDHFWDRAKAWILNQITSAVTAMNTQITENKNNIAANTSDISALKTSVAGKADKAHTHVNPLLTGYAGYHNHSFKGYGGNNITRGKWNFIFNFTALCSKILLGKNGLK